MLANYLVPLAAVLVVLAVGALVGALLLWRRVNGARAGLERASVSLDERALTLPLALSSARALIAERGAAVEHGRWLLARFDEGADNLAASMARGRASLDTTRMRLDGARESVERLKSAARLIIRAIELRRAILG